MLRVRQGMTQVVLATRAGVGRRAVSMLELGRGEHLPLARIEAIVHALGGRLDLRLLWNGPELDRLLDEAHAAVAALVKRRLERWGWDVRVEVSFSRYGERGRIDLLAYNAALRVLLVIEVKTELVDVQGLLGTLDQKARLARHVADRFGWRPRRVVPAIVFLEHSATRKRLRFADTLFSSFTCRGRAALSWVRKPMEPVPDGLLWFTSAAVRRDAARQRVRQPRLG